MNRDPHSHKTQNGTVAIIGGSSRFHGAPIFSALAAEASGVDLIYPFTSGHHETVTRMASLNFIVQTFKGESLTKKDVVRVLNLLHEVHIGVLGPGMAETNENEVALAAIAAGSQCPLILDARALRPEIVKKIQKGATTILTPHLGELEYLTGKSLTDTEESNVRALAASIAKEHHCIVVLKGHEDFIVDSKGKKQIVKGGNAGLTKGGTGDALAGLIAGLIAQGIKPFEACVMGTTIIKRAATVLYPEKGYGYSTMDLIGQFAHLVRTYEK